MKNSIKNILFIFVSVLVINCFCSCNSGTTYGTTKESITECFPNMPEFTSCFWRIENPSKTILGPSFYYFKGCVILSSYSSEKLYSSLVWEECIFQIDDDFVRGFRTDIDFDDVIWYSNEEFSKYIYQNTYYIGDIYYAPDYDMIYFEAMPS